MPQKYKTGQIVATKTDGISSKPVKVKVLQYLPKYSGPEFGGFDNYFCEYPKGQLNLLICTNDEADGEHGEFTNPDIGISECLGIPRNILVKYMRKFRLNSMHESKKNNTKELIEAIQKLSGKKVTLKEDSINFSGSTNYKITSEKFFVQAYDEAAANNIAEHVKRYAPSVKVEGKVISIAIYDIVKYFSNNVLSTKI